ncbi:hypothetical protein DLAC_06330 [Tieghemostelium lacteum]|uniref:Pesticidal crystal protein N-terminal domain-containing protein n=1 Tax=Tieghemostelium lacteum TaxID=361077 RepID=A0A151ZEK8_TIELA|nr:hypothetical protein DLAC_06330 [Tieghemostelium lacteum]|eukprot:KYQ92365.1 hypothetical protein DLAC_06330 [Tieghemostelium lacteum]
MLFTSHIIYPADKRFHFIYITYSYIYYNFINMDFETKLRQVSKDMGIGEENWAFLMAPGLGGFLIKENIITANEWYQLQNGLIGMVPFIGPLLQSVVGIVLGRIFESETDQLKKQIEKLNERINEVYKKMDALFQENWLELCQKKAEVVWSNLTELKKDLGLLQDTIDDKDPEDDIKECRRSVKNRVTNVINGFNELLIFCAHPTYVRKCSKLYIGITLGFAYFYTELDRCGESWGFNTKQIKGSKSYKSAKQRCSDVLAESYENLSKVEISKKIKEPLWHCFTDLDPTVYPIPPVMPNDKIIPLDEKEYNYILRYDPQHQLNSHNYRPTSEYSDKVDIYSGCRGITIGLDQYRQHSDTTLFFKNTGSKVFSLSFHVLSCIMVSHYSVKIEKLFDEIPSISSFTEAELYYYLSRSASTTGFSLIPGLDYKKLMELHLKYPEENRRGSFGYDDYMDGTTNKKEEVKEDADVKLILYNMCKDKLDFPNQRPTVVYETDEKNRIAHHTAINVPNTDREESKNTVGFKDFPNYGGVRGGKITIPLINFPNSFYGTITIETYDNELSRHQFGATYAYDPFKVEYSKLGYLEFSVVNYTVTK